MMLDKGGDYIQTFARPTDQIQGAAELIRHFQLVQWVAYVKFIY